MSTAPDPPTLANRRTAAFERAANCTDSPADVVLIHDPVEIRYLTGLVEGSHTVLLTKNKPILLTNRMFRDRAPIEAPGCDIRIAPAKPAGRTDDDRLLELLDELNARSLGIQVDTLSLKRYRELVKRLGEERLVEVSDVVGPGRIVKDDAELKLIRQAIEIQEAAMRQMVDKGVGHWIGRSEKSLAAELVHTLVDLGADGDAFDGGVIVASGPNSAACHHRPTERIVEQGDAILIDWGAEVAGYKSDMTRMAYTGPMAEPFRTIHDRVASALNVATKAVKPGFIAKELDGVARDHLKAFDPDYEDLFRHSLGHGVGLDVHEGPSLSRTEVPLAPGMVLAIEPGIYYEGQGGVRLENTVIVTDNGCEVLGNLPLALEPK